MLTRAYPPRSYRNACLPPLKAAATTRYATEAKSAKAPRSPNVIKTTKLAKDLPNTLVRDGISVGPLPEYKGGLEFDSRVLLADRRRRRKASSQASETKGSSKDPSVMTRNSERAQLTELSGNRDLASATDLESQASSVKARLPSNDLAKEILSNLSRFPHCILLTRVGQFYESYFDQAAEVSSLLSIKLATRRWDGQDVLMAGFPVLQLDRHLKTLVQQHQKSVAMCEEYRHTEYPDRFTRKVSRILTPGTLIDEPFLNHSENNYLLAISNGPHPSEGIGLAWIDVSTGEFFSETSAISSLPDDLARIAPREVVLDKALPSADRRIIIPILEDAACHVSNISLSVERDTFLDGQPVLSDELLSRDEPQIFTATESCAILLLVTFLRAHLLDHMPPLVNPVRRDDKHRMHIDSHTIRSLEIKEALRDGGVKGSLLSVIKRTVTSSGTRLLARWLCAPSISLEEIKARQNIVLLLMTRPHLRLDILQLLKSLGDASRIVQKFLLNHGSTDDLLSIRATIICWHFIKRRFEFERSVEQTASEGSDSPWFSLDLLLCKVVDLSWLAERIADAIDDFDVRKKERLMVGKVDDALEDDDTSPATDIFGRPPYGQRWKVKPEFSQELTKLHSQLSKLVHDKEQLEARWRSDYDATSLTLRVTPGLGMHVHLSKARRDRVKFLGDAKFVTIQQSNTTHAYFHLTWARLGNSISQVVSDICSAERKVFEAMRNEVCGQIRLLRCNAHVMDELDVTCAFAELAVDMHYTMPTMVEEPIFRVANARHPTVELGLREAGKAFIPNNVELAASSRLHIITGPNMAGKSTYLRQVALIAILAQTGSFVPADAAQIGIVDKVFSRVGARDDLFRDHSTFMVEMLETSNILRQATEKSLVIMDEVGRGTTIKDGLAIAFATVHHLYHKNRSRGLFATHFHELADMLGYESKGGSGAFPEIDFLCNDVDEIDEMSFAYSHRLRRGVNRQSHALKVAKLGGMPQSAVDTAGKVATWLEVNRLCSREDRERLSRLGRHLP